jgi:eukaryotic-like serine/threonine-protein kinase
MPLTTGANSRQPASAQADAFEAAVEAFEAAWRLAGTADIRALVEMPNLQECRIELLHELVRVDLEYHWKAAAAGIATSTTPCRQLLEDYVSSYPELGPFEDLPLDLIIDEYRVRRRWGDRPNAAGYLNRFPHRAAEIMSALAKVNLEDERETDPPPALPGIESASLGHKYQTADVPQFDYRDFVLEAHLGSGGIGKVYRAWWKSQRKHVAVKMLRKSWWRQAGADELFFREAAILVHLRHPNIVVPHGIGRIPHGACFLVLELIDGCDLSSLIGKELPLARVIEWIAQAADALAFAHRRGIIHRDVKPSNLLLDPSGNIRVGDFGLALAPAFGHDATGGLVGTVVYMAPEQLFGTSEPPSPASDIFALGAVLFSLLTARTPFEGNSLTNVMKRRLEFPVVPPIRAFRPNLPAKLEDVVTRCLAIEPRERFAGADELATALRDERIVRERVNQS